MSSGRPVGRSKINATGGKCFTTASLLNFLWTTYRYLFENLEPWEVLWSPASSQSCTASWKSRKCCVYWLVRVKFSTWAAVRSTEHAKFYDSASTLRWLFVHLLFVLWAWDVEIISARIYRKWGRHNIPIFYCNRQALREGKLMTQNCIDDRSSLPSLQIRFP